MRSARSSQATPIRPTTQFGAGRLDEVDVGGDELVVGGQREVGEDAGEVLGQGADLLLLALQRDQLAVGEGLDEEGAAGRARRRCRR